MRRIELYLWALIFALLLGAQSIQQPHATVTASNSFGGVLPNNCSAGSVFFLTTATAGQNLYGCTSAGWVLEGGGGGGGGATTVYADEETPFGGIDGANPTFSLAHTPSPSQSLLLTRNGLLLDQGGDYTLSGHTITFATGAVPQPGDSILAWYRHS